MIDKSIAMQTVERVLEGESEFFIRTTEQFNKGIDHIFQLITDAYTLYINEAFTSSVFLSITVIEEVEKMQMGMYIKHSGTYVKKDKLRDHKTKEIIGANYTVCFGERIKNAMAINKLEEIFELAYTGELKELREKAIYCKCKDGELVTPNDIINKEFSKNILLFAIESFDDNLVGYTDYSMCVSEKTDVIFEKVVGE